MKSVPSHFVGRVVAELCTIARLASARDTVSWRNYIVTEKLVVVDEGSSSSSSSPLLKIIMQQQYN